MKTCSEIRKLFIDYFVKNDHLQLPSASLIPKDDPTLLFTTAGMVPFKPYFAGIEKPPKNRVVSVQKCFRTTDLEIVGKTERHCTFFEMLGNFSFGDYFKKEAIQFAWDFSINYLKFDPKDIWITIFENDDESKNIWMEVGVPEEKIIRSGAKDNFWGPAGDTGACGPCTELYLDRGISKGKPDCGKTKKCQPGCDCDRFLEYWNLVLNQFNKINNAELLPLEKKGIDTGAGLERLALLLQKVDSVYDTDELKEIIRYIEKITSISYNEYNASIFRVITDHSRSVTFLLSDGILPDKTGRGYVVRRLIRRAVLYIQKLEIKEPFLYKMIDKVSSIYKEFYPEVGNSLEQIKEVILNEERLFIHTLESGMNRLNSLVEEYKSKNIRLFSGKDGFLLYGTFGFPPELTQEILEEHELEFNFLEFHKELEKDRQLSRETWKKSKGEFSSFLKNLPETFFKGYEFSSVHSSLLLIISENDTRSKIQATDPAILVFSETPFYPEGGGQLGDQGFIKTNTGVFKVYDTQKESNYILHFGEVIDGVISTGQESDLTIDLERRNHLKMHHSGTHLLNGALRKILGNHVEQKASLVATNYLRFDFSHQKPLAEMEIFQVENLVNEAIQNRISVQTNELPIEEAKKSGAVATFGEKYGEKVRVVSMGDRSIEFCGGTHVTNTAELEYFLIKKESSPGAMTRRIEALCGSYVLDFLKEEIHHLKNKISNPEIVDPFNQKIREEISQLVSFSITDLINQHGNPRNLLYEIQKTQKQIEEIKIQLIKEKKKSQNIQNQINLEEIQNTIFPINGKNYIFYTFENLQSSELKNIFDLLKVKISNLIIFFVDIQKASNDFLMLLATNDISITSKFHCGKILKDVCSIANGSGGGKPEMAQGGGKNLESIKEMNQFVLNKIKEIM